MSQASITIANGSGASVRAAINSALQRLASRGAGNSRPADAVSGEVWVDNNTPSTTVWTVYFFDGTDDIPMGQVDTVNNLYIPYIGAVATLAGNTASTSVANMAAVQNSLTGGFVSKIRNGMMDVTGRGTSGTVTAGSPAYTVDGFIVSSTGANVPWAASRNALGVAGIANVLNLSTATGMTNLNVKQRIESYLAASLNSQQVTFQAVVFQNTGSTITPTLTVKHATALDDWTSSTTDVSAVSLQACASGANTVVSYTFAANGNSYLGLEVTLDFGSGANVAAKSIYTTAWDLRATPGVATGLNASPPAVEVRPYPVEALICERYLPTFRVGASTLGLAQATTTTSAYFAAPFATNARIPPTGISVSGASHFQLLNASGGAYNATTAVTFSGAWTRGGVITLTVASGLVAGNASLFGGNTSAATLIFTGPEL